MGYRVRDVAADAEGFREEQLILLDSFLDKVVINWNLGNLSTLFYSVRFLNVMFMIVLWGAGLPSLKGLVIINLIVVNDADIIFKMLWPSLLNL